MLVTRAGVAVFQARFVSRRATSRTRHTGVDPRLCRQQRLPLVPCFVGEVVQALPDVVAVLARTFFEIPFELIAPPFVAGEIVVGEVAPGFFETTGKRLPATFRLLFAWGVHSFVLLWMGLPVPPEHRYASF